MNLLSLFLPLQSNKIVNRKMKDLIMRTVLIYVVGALIFSACSQFRGQLDSSEGLEKLIEAEIEASLSGNMGLVTFSGLGDFQWDQLLILAPYSHLGELEKELGVNLDGLSHFDIDQRNDVALIVFLDGNTPVRVVAYPRSSGDFAEIEPVLIPREHTVFQLQPVPSGRVRMRLVGM